MLLAQHAPRHRKPQIYQAGSLGGSGLTVARAHAPPTQGLAFSSAVF